MKESVIRKILLDVWERDMHVDVAERRIRASIAEELEEIPNADAWTIRVAQAHIRLGIAQDRIRKGGK